MSDPVAFGIIIGIIAGTAFNVVCILRLSMRLEKKLDAISKHLGIEP